MSLNARGLLETLVSFRDARKHMAGRLREAERRMAEAEVDALQLRPIITAIDELIAEREAQLRKLQEKA